MPTGFNGPGSGFAAHSSFVSVSLGKMQIESNRSGDIHTMHLFGLLDAAGGAELDAAVQELIRSGASQIVMDMSGLNFISSAGLRVLITTYNQMKKLNGRFSIAQPPKDVAHVLKMTGILDMLLVKDVPVVPPTSKGEPYEDELLRGMVYALGTGELTGRLIGRPQLLPQCGFGEDDCRRVEVGRSVFGLGLGALGNQFTDCRSRFGEFLSVQGMTICQPGDGTRIPDYLLPSGGLVPNIQLLYGLETQGQFSHFLRFERADHCESIRLQNVVDRILTSNPRSSPLVGFVMLAECCGLIGAALRESPANARLAAGETLFSFPGIRRRVALSADPVHQETTVVVAGLVGRECSAEHRAFLRPLNPEETLFGHLHAAVFGYETLAAGQIDLRETLEGMFRRSQPEAVIHLLFDDRRGPEPRESEFSRGAVWFGPLNVTVES